MRFFLAGILIFLAPITTFAQIKGEVEKIGFNNIYRPDCWTPMLVRIHPQGGQTGLYKLQVKQKDLDGDLPTFEREISLTAEAGAREQRFWTYFLPTPVNKGLSDRSNAGTLRNLQEELRVFLTDADGKQIAQLPITSTIENVDPLPTLYSSRRGSKLILCVVDGRSQPAWSEYQNATGPTGILGIVEDVTMVSLRVADLPENPIGFEAVDAIVWMDVDPLELKRGGDEKWRAVDAYIRQGGRFVICQSPEWQKTLAFGELLPVRLEGIFERDDLNPLRRMANPGAANPPRRNPWDALQGPFRVARATAKPDTIVEEWVQWDTKGEDRTPYIVRAPYGLGSVTWIAQDIGDPAISTRARIGWPYVWDRVFGWKNEPLMVTQQTPERITRPYAPAGGIDFGQSLLKQMDHRSRTASLIALAVAFFVVYWLVAGPGLYAYLFSKRKTEMSWFMFGASAVAATALTLVIVRLVLRGPPELRHVSIVQAAPMQPAVVHSRFGLYIPRDGNQRIQLEGTAPETVSTISAFANHPANLLETPINQAGRLSYTVPISDINSDSPPAVVVPYRSSLKKFQASWIGDIGARIEGSARLVEQGAIDGTIVNGTGQRLRNIYLAFRHPSTAWGDTVLYLPTWDDGVTLNLNREFNGTDDNRTPMLNPQRRIVPEEGIRIRGRLLNEWQPFWLDGFRSNAVKRSFPILSFFDRLAPARKLPDPSPDRYELLRRGARKLDISAALAAGQLVVLAESDGPLPFPLRVEGSLIGGEGTVFYQFVLPLDDSILLAAYAEREQEQLDAPPAEEPPTTEEPPPSDQL
jgi:hypothetical protein